MHTTSIPSSRIPFTDLQGQYLAYIHCYTLVNGRPPAEVDMQAFFGKSPPTVHQMVEQLERLGLVTRLPRQPRSVRVIVDPDSLPRLRFQPIKTSVSRH